MPYDWRPPTEEGDEEGKKEGEDNANKDEDDDRRSPSASIQDRISTRRDLVGTGDQFERGIAAERAKPDYGRQNGSSAYQQAFSYADSAPKLHYLTPQSKTHMPRGEGIHIYGDFGSTSPLHHELVDPCTKFPHPPVTVSHC
jgi:hypothetical protein